MATLLSQEEIDALLTDVTGGAGSPPLDEREKRKIYYARLSGIVNSVIGKKSWFRPNLIKR